VRRIPGGRRALLYALDGQTGKNSGRAAQIESWNHFSGLTVANGRATSRPSTACCIAEWRGNDGAINGR
jgi:hypothetical protein